LRSFAFSLPLFCQMSSSPLSASWHSSHFISACSGYDGVLGNGSGLSWECLFALFICFVYFAFLFCLSPWTLFQASPHCSECVPNIPKGVRGMR
jgi:hypothetical protein